MTASLFSPKTHRGSCITSKPWYLKRRMGRGSIYAYKKFHFQEDNIVDELKNYQHSVEDFKSFKQYIEELSSQLNILSNESKFSQKLIDDSTLLFESFQHLQQENENLKEKYELSQKEIQILESNVTELKSQVCFC